ncbi:MAG: peptide-methionine (S)-S-oxide reductase MsrA [Phycisphaerae bacterium]|nr:peptide-methionine (S)-S-oxide reductase MsrA [Phycisphaerae bacterium]
MIIATRWTGLICLLFVALFGVSCDATAAPAHDLPKPADAMPPSKAGETQQLVLAGGCFWATQAVFEKLNGVTKCVAGYAGGSKDTASYEQVSEGNTGHAESVEITFDPTKISYGELLRVYFTLFDPTTLNRQGNDVGTNYRSTIFYANDEQKKIAVDYIAQLNAARIFSDPIVTTLEPLKGFYPAEEYHQDYAEKNPNQSYVQYCDVPKLKLLHEKFADLLKPTTQP